MTKFISKMLLAAAIICCIMGGLITFDMKIKESWGPGTVQQLNTSFDTVVSNEYDTIILGNSRIYRGINPAMLEDVCNCYNFSHDNDAFNQCYYKLLYLEENGVKFDRLILGVDYFEFCFKSDTRNYIYDFLLGADYAKDYDNNLVQEYLNDIDYYFWTIRCPKLTTIITNLRTYPGENSNNLRDNGQYVVEGQHASPDDTVTRETEMLELAYDYYVKIIEYCAAHDIEVYLVMPPVRDAELASYTEEYMAASDKMMTDVLDQNGFSADNYMNFRDVPQFKDYTKYIDISHFTPEGADEFTTYMCEYIKERYSAF
ncbi:MAG: hypothetical protein HUJ70_07700 [Pseudobutyrivibrio sp.]|nr:hypothetical protein [Pseudobutyrivibrio sp.]